MTAVLSFYVGYALKILGPSAPAASRRGLDAVANFLLVTALLLFLAMVAALAA